MCATATTMILIWAQESSVHKKRRLLRLSDQPLPFSASALQHHRAQLPDFRDDEESQLHQGWNHLVMPWMCCRAEGGQGPAPSSEGLSSLKAELPGNLWSSANTKCNWFSSLRSMTGVTFPELDKGGPDVHDRFLHKHFTFFCFSSCLLFFSGLKKAFHTLLLKSLP